MTKFFRHKKNIIQLFELYAELFSVSNQRLHTIYEIWVQPVFIEFRMQSEIGLNPSIRIEMSFR